ncbi:MAG: Sec-independent protein translocase subunit TatA/TatB [Gemmatimonadales bacterium]
MFGNLGAGEIVVLLLIVLLVFGANRLPDAGRAVGKGLREFKRALSDAEESIRQTPPSGDEPPRDARPKRLVE